MGIKRHYRRDQRQGRRDWSKKSPRPDTCDLEACRSPIPADHELYYDSRFPLLLELTRENGEKYYNEKVACFCSEDCRATHRSRYLVYRFHVRQPPSP